MDLLKRIIRKLCSFFCRNLKPGSFSTADKGAALTALLRRMPDFDLAVNILLTRRFQRPIGPTFVSCPEGHRLMILAPHQDDEIIGCGGLILHSVQAGKEVLPIYLSDGRNNVPGYDMDEVPELRRQEAVRVWDTIGGIKPVFWNIPNKQFSSSRETAKRIYDALNEYKPDCVFIPFFLEDPDSHRKTNHMLLMAREFGPLPDIEIWAYQVSTMICPNVGVEISDVVEKKHELMQMWKSQNAVFDYAHYARGLNIYNGFCYRGKGAVQAHVELFFVVKMEEYLGLLDLYFGKNDHDRIYGEKTRYS